MQGVMQVSTDWVRLGLEGGMTIAVGYVALSMKALRAELRLEISKAVDKVFEKVSEKFTTEEVCSLRYTALSEQVRSLKDRPSNSGRPRTN